MPAFASRRGSLMVRLRCGRGRLLSDPSDVSSRRCRLRPISAGGPNAAMEAERTLVHQHGSRSSLLPARWRLRTQVAAGAEALRSPQEHQKELCPADGLRSS